VVEGQLPAHEGWVGVEHLVLEEHKLILLGTISIDLFEELWKLMN